jgi:hypothetical protein
VPQGLDQITNPHAIPHANGDQDHDRIAMAVATVAEAAS